jgi:hypothetical protein
MTITQTTTDTADLEVYGPVTLCVISYGNRTSTKTKSTAKLIDSGEAQSAAKKKRPINALNDLRDLYFITDEGLDVARTLGLYSLRGYDHTFEHKYPKEVKLLIGGDQPDALRAALAGKSDQFITEHVFYFVEAEALKPIGSTSASPVINFPVQLNISDQYVDIDAAEDYLKNNPMVKAIARNRGIPGYYDHVPASLNISLQLDDATRVAIDAAATARYGGVASGSFLAEVLIWPPRSGDQAFGDPLGLLPYVRTDKINPYYEPREDDY